MHDVFLGILSATIFFGAAGGLSIADETRFEEALQHCAQFDLDRAIQCLESDDLNVQETVLLTRLFVAKGDLDRARDVLQRDHGELSSDPTLESERAAFDCRLGHYQLALDRIDDVLKARRDDDRARVVRARVLLSLDQGDEAMSILSHVLSKSPKRADAHYWSAWAHLLQGRPLDARAGFLQCLRVMGEVGVDPLYSVGACKEIGKICVDIGRYEEGLHWLGQIVDRVSDPKEVLVRLGVAHDMMSHYDRAEQRFEEALTLDPQDIAVRLRLANILENQSRNDEALAHYERVVAVSKDHAYARQRLGNLLREQGRKDDARVMLKRSIELDPTRPEASFGLAELDRDERRWEEAAAHYERAIDVDPLYYKAYYGLSRVLPRTGRDEDRVRAKEMAGIFEILRVHGARIATYRTMTYVSPDRVDNRVELAKLLLDIGRQELALERLDDVLVRRPGFYLAHRERGRVYMAMKRPDDAIAEWERARSILNGALEGLEKNPPSPSLESRRQQYREELESIEALIESFR